MKNNQLNRIGKNSKRRLHEKAKEFARLLRQNEAMFHLRWNKRVVGWMSEIRFRARTWGETNSAGERGEIFDLLQQVDRFIRECGAEVEVAVGAETRETLMAECVKAVGQVFGAKFSASLVQGWLYRRF